MANNDESISAETKLSFRSYEPDYRACCIDVFQSNCPKFFLDYEMDLFLSFLDRQDCPYFVVFDNDHAVGCGGYGQRDDSNWADLCWGMVDSRWHGKQVGAYLLFLRLFKIISDTDVSHVRLDTSQHTYGFFEKFGFNTEWTKAEGYGDGLDKYEMLLELNEENRILIEKRWARFSI